MITLTIQKSGRLSEKTKDLLKESGISFENGSRNPLKSRATNFPLQILYLRDDDIPECVADGIADIGIVGEIHPKVLSSFDINNPVYFLEVNIDMLLERKKDSIKFSEIPPFPSSERDLTITIKADVLMEDIFKSFSKLKSPIIEKTFLLDIYKNIKLGRDKKNITLRFIYRNKNKTISFEEVEKEHLKIVEEIKKKLKDYLIS